MHREPRKRGFTNSAERADPSRPVNNSDLSFKRDPLRHVSPLREI